MVHTDGSLIRGKEEKKRKRREWTFENPYNYINVAPHGIVRVLTFEDRRSSRDRRCKCKELLRPSSHRAPPKSVPSTLVRDPGRKTLPGLHSSVLGCSQSAVVCAMFII